MLANAVRFLRAHDDFILIAHVSPDGDTLGSCLALYAALRQLGKRAQVVCEDPVPKIYRFLPGAEEVLLPERARGAAAAACIDCADLARAGGCRGLFEAAAHTLNIDHHGTNDRYADENFVCRAAATGELIYRTLTDLEAKITGDIAACLYAAIVTDTGNFSYSNTTPETLRVAAELLEAGIDLPYLNRMLFRSTPAHKMRLLGLAILKTELYENGRIGVAALSAADLERCGATGEDTEGIIDSIRDIDTVEIAALLRQSGDGEVRVSLRGKSIADVSRIAARFGGGGHRLAAGCKLCSPIEQAQREILCAAVETLNGTVA